MDDRLDEGFQVFEFTPSDIKHMILDKLDKAGTKIKDRKVQFQIEYDEDRDLDCMKIILGPTEEHCLKSINKTLNKLQDEVKDAMERNKPYEKNQNG